MTAQRTATTLIMLLLMLAGCDNATTKAPKQPRVIYSFSGSNGHQKLVPYVEFCNTGADVLNEVDATVVVFFEDGSKSEFKRQWPQWESQERKRVELPESRASIQKYELSASATIRGERVSCRAEFNVGSINFDLKKDEGSFSHDVICIYKGTIELTEVDATITVYYENGTKPEFKRYWASLRPGEQRKLNITAQGKIERIGLAGSATVNGKKETFTLGVSW